MSVDVEKVKAVIHAAALEALDNAAEDLLGRAQRDAPIREGTLRGSGHTGPPVTKGNTTSIEVRFSTPYAAAQHEGHAIMHGHGKAWDWRARNYPMGGGPKYLSKNLLAMGPRYTAAIAANVRKALEGL